MPGSDIGFLTQALSGLARRQEAIANNIANAETPGYQRADVAFERVLQDQLSAQHEASRTVPRGAAGSSGAMPLRGGAGGDGLRDRLAARLAGLEPPGIDTAPRNDGNTVDLDMEMTSLAETQMRFAGLTSVLSGRLRLLRSIVENG